MARTSVEDTILILDDEIYNLRWMIEFFKNRGLKVETFNDANQIISEIKKEIFRCLVIDLNVPIRSPLDRDAEEKGIFFADIPDYL